MHKIFPCRKRSNNCYCKNTIIFFFFSKLIFQKLEREKKRKDMQIRVWITKISNRNSPAKISKFFSFFLFLFLFFLFFFFLSFRREKKEGQLSSSLVHFFHSISKIFTEVRTFSLKFDSKGPCCSFFSRMFVFDKPKTFRFTPLGIPRRDATYSLFRDSGLIRERKTGAEQNEYARNSCNGDEYSLSELEYIYYIEFA